MKIKDGFVVREVAGNNIVVPVGAKTVDFNGIITLNETGRFLWDILAKGAEKPQLISAMLDEYDTDETTAAADIDAFIKKLLDAGIAE